MQRKQLHTKKELADFRRELHQNLTPAEAFLWKYIKARGLEGRRFTKQHSIGNYVVDFYCASEKLIIELDGEVHLNPTTEEYDIRRTTYFEEIGFRVIRFENKIVFEHLSSVFTGNQG